MDYINHYWKTHFCPPSVREIQSGTGISSTGHIAWILVSLGKNGMIVYNKNGKSRQIVPVWVANLIRDNDDAK